MNLACPSCATPYTLSDENIRGKVVKLRCRGCPSVLLVSWHKEGEAPSVTASPALEGAPDGQDAAPCALPPASSGAPSPLPPQEESEDGLFAAFGALLDAARAKDQPRLLALLGQLRPPKPAELFARLFGEENALAMSEAYQKLAPMREALFLQLLSVIVEEEAQRGESVPMEAHLGRVEELRAEREFAQTFLRPFPALEDDVVFGFLSLAHLSFPFWCYEAGAWRFLGDLRVLAPQKPTAEGLAARLRLLAQLREMGQGVELAFVQGDLALPAPEAWFSETFGPKAGAALAEEYQQAMAEEALQEIGGIIEHRCSQKRADEAHGEMDSLLGRGSSVRSSEPDIQVEGHLSPYSQDVTGLQRKALLSMRRPVPLYTARLYQGYTLWSFAFVEGGWRWLGKMRALSAFAPSSWQPSPGYPLSEEGLTCLILDKTHFAGESEREPFLESCTPLLLPDAAWFSARLGPEAGAALAPYHEEKERVLALFASFLHQEQFRIQARRVSGPDDPEATFAQRLWMQLTPSGPPLFSARHFGPEDNFAQTSWVYEGGHWRLLFLDMLSLLPAWREHLRYPWPEDPSSARFPPTEEGLKALLKALLTSARQDRALFLHLYQSLFPGEIKADWLSLFVQGEEERQKEAAHYAQRWQDQNELLLARLTSSRGTPEEHTFLIRPHPEIKGLFAVLWQAPWEDAPLRCLFPVCFCDGAWRLLGRLEWTEDLMG